MKTRHMSLERLRILEERFWGSVDTNGDCWEWTAGLTPKGYGEFFAGSERVRSHRASWMLHTGEEIPDGLGVLHKCDNRVCVRPDHLFLGTNADNVRDMIQKGRKPVKLTPEQEREALIMYRCGVSKREIGRKFGAAARVIYRITRGEFRLRGPGRWASVGWLL